MNEILKPQVTDGCVDESRMSGQQRSTLSASRARFWRKLGLTACLLTMTVPALAQKLRVVELFTSHGCSSCPRADDLMGEMSAADPDLLLLEYHVDYWNSLVHGGDGNFVDPYSSSAYTDRQRQYRQVALRGRPGVYTPQAIINGNTAAVGSDRSAIAGALESSPQAPLAISIEPEANELSIEVQGAEAALAAAADAQIILLRYHRQRTTDITGGENRHRTLVNHNIVHDMSVLGSVATDADMRFEVSASAEGDGCAVLIQSASLDALHAAVGCP